MSRTIAQIRSSFALEEIRGINEKRDEFGKLAAGLPAMILQNGLGLTLAFLLAKGTNKNGQIQPTDKHIKAFDILMRWLKKQNIIDTTVDNRAGTVLALSKMTQQKYLQAQSEVMSVLEWVKRYANAGLFSS
jgi:CRISPR-associated protein Cmr5